MIWIVATALAMPTRPEPHPPRPDECAQAVDLVPADAPPADLVRGRVVLCRATAVPTSDLADLLADRQWALQLRDHARIDAAVHEHEVESLEWRISQLRADLERERAPVPPLRRPGVQVGVGLVAGVGLSLGMAWAYGEVAR